MHTLMALRWRCTLIPTFAAEQRMLSQGICAHPRDLSDICSAASVLPWSYPK